MRKDSELFLRKSLQYKDETGENAFELGVAYFSEIPNIEVEIDDIFDELKYLKCISKKSTILGRKIKIYLTLDGITYFDGEHKKNQPEITVNISGKQINFATDNGKVDVAQYEKDINNIPKTIVIEDNKNRSSSASNGLEDGMLWVGIIVVFALTVIYLNYRFQVQLGIIIASIVMEVVTCLACYNSKRARVIYGKNIKEMLYFNIGSILCVPILLGVINSPMYTSKINLDVFKQSADKEGIIVAFFNSEYAYYALFQMVGMIFLALFLLHIVCSDIYIISITNIVTGKKGKSIWNGLFKLTYMRGKSWKTHVEIGMFFLFISILFAGGIIPCIIDVITKINASFSVV